ncbi:uncharacterized protein CLUP02_15991 [Colletotrichum lupini]|uniref:Uncharacterized protein n=1 Tax=Colletotrichum lupini TaxID=145971 RepID=A0A9Q8T9F8_9PEZI|nr:uncharacterized protein CLUP02_15991 [Colletotrichum lupini]UQC90461.1 hypothetical protein CLUP02_15991 [Colletotrichum lupini]
MRRAMCLSPEPLQNLADLSGSASFHSCRFIYATICRHVSPAVCVSLDFTAITACAPLPSCGHRMSGSSASLRFPDASKLIHQATPFCLVKPRVRHAE